MSEPALNARIVPDKIGDATAKAARLTPSRFRAAISIAINVGKAEIQERTHVGWSAALRRGYTTDIRQKGRQITGIISNPVVYHDIAEEGRRPGKRPPVAPLIPWVGSKLGVPPDERAAVAFLVARKIGAKGYEGHRMVEQGMAATRGKLKNTFRKMGLAIAKDIHPG